MNKVYVCYECYYDYCDTWKDVVKIVDNEEKAKQWKAEFKSTETDWREYQEMTVE